MPLVHDSWGLLQLLLVEIAEQRRPPSPLFGPRPPWSPPFIASIINFAGPILIGVQVDHK